MKHADERPRADVRTFPEDAERVSALLPPDGSRVIATQLVEQSGLSVARGWSALAQLCLAGQAKTWSDGDGYTWARRI